MNRKQTQIGIASVALALLCLLYYSLERTAWLFELFEKDTARAMGAAVVVELAAVALLAGASALDAKSRPWANRALLAVLSVQALGNLSAGYLKGGVDTLATFGGSRPAYYVAATLWLVANLAVPGLVLCLSKLLEQLLAKHATLPAEPKIDRSAWLHALFQKPQAKRQPALANAVRSNTVRATIIADGACKYCGETGLAATERARHGKSRKRTGSCV